MFVSCVHPVAVLNAEFCMTCSVYVGGFGGLSEHGLCELCPVRFLVVGESPSVLL